MFLHSDEFTSLVAGENIRLSAGDGNVQISTATLEIFGDESAVFTAETGGDDDGGSVRLFSSNSVITVDSDAVIFESDGFVLVRNEVELLHASGNTCENTVITATDSGGGVLLSAGGLDEATMHFDSDVLDVDASEGIEFLGNNGSFPDVAVTASHNNGNVDILYIYI